ncbi:MAG TPA: hypothetical protein VFK94_05640, partial [Patescibacteria group bacterium]|nr:hypothetical protein [Patescibacteria group bacterium]
TGNGQFVAGDGAQEDAKSWIGQSLDQAAPSFTNSSPGSFSPRVQVQWDQTDTLIAVETSHFYSYARTLPGSSGRLVGEVIAGRTGFGPDRNVSWELLIGTWGAGTPTSLHPGGTVIASGTTLATFSGNSTPIDVLLHGLSPNDIQLYLRVLSPRTPDSLDANFTVHLFNWAIELQTCIAAGVSGDCEDSGSTSCTECEDPSNPGFQLPDFTPGFMPTFRRQIGDPTTNLDSFICTLESAAMVLDWHTRGAISVWGGELIPWCGKTEAQIAASGSNLDNARQAWLHWSQYLEVRSGGSWANLMTALSEGRAVILQGDYGVFTNAIKCQANFEDNHAISVYPYQIADRLLVGDPLCSNFYGVPISALQDYAETLGAAVYGVTSPQKILFAVSRPWVP